MLRQGVPIGEAAAVSGVKVPTIRYYEQIGLLQAPPRTEGNRRHYDVADLQRLAFIRHARELGFEIEAIRQLLDLSGQPERSCAQVDLIARGHLADIDTKIARLSALRAEVLRMTEECAHGRRCRMPRHRSAD